MRHGRASFRERATKSWHCTQLERVPSNLPLPFSMPRECVQSTIRRSPEWGIECCLDGGWPLIEPHSMRSVIGQSPPGRSMIGESEFQFLATKVVSPRSLGLIERPRLLDTITQLPAKRLAVIKAPAGFGKTSLAAGWFERLRESGNSVAWLTIDPDDDEPSRFLLYVSQALQRACHGVGLGANDLINETFLISPRAIVSVLLNELMDVDEDVYLFLEDYHWITDRKIHESLVFFLTHAPSHCHVVLTTRTEPPIPLASLRARNQLLELDASALRFDLQETHTFIERENFGTLAPSETAWEDGRLASRPKDCRLHLSARTGLRAVHPQSYRHAASDWRLSRRDARWPSG